MEKIDLINIAVTMVGLGWLGLVMFKPMEIWGVKMKFLNWWAIGSFIIVAIGGLLMVIAYYM
jgi:CBS domain containing-hemolysin-like protein